MKIKNIYLFVINAKNSSKGLKKISAVVSCDWNLPGYTI